MGTDTASSDVDICFVADGITEWINGLNLDAAVHRKYPSTCAPKLSATRVGFKSKTFAQVVPKEMYDFWKSWDDKLSGGLQITFQDSGADLPHGRSTCRCKRRHSSAACMDNDPYRISKNMIASHFIHFYFSFHFIYCYCFGSQRLYS